MILLERSVSETDTQIGYARSSTLEQEAGLEAQVRDLTALGCGKLFREQVTSVAARNVRDAALAFARSGDTVVVTKLDRLARALIHLGNFIAAPEAR